MAGESLRDLAGNSGSGSTTAKLIAALFFLSRDIESEDGVANAALLEAAQRMLALRELVNECAPLVRAQHGAEHMLDGFNPRPRPAIDGLLARIEAEVAA